MSAGASQAVTPWLARTRRASGTSSIAARRAEGWLPCESSVEVVHCQRGLLAWPRTCRAIQLNSCRSGSSSRWPHPLKGRLATASTSRVAPAVSSPRWATERRKAVRYSMASLVPVAECVLRIAGETPLHQLDVEPLRQCLACAQVEFTFVHRVAQQLGFACPVVPHTGERGELSHRRTTPTGSRLA